MSLIQEGVNMHFGLGSTTVVITDATGIYQNYDFSDKTEKIVAKDQRGNPSSWTYTGDTQECSITYLASDSATAAGNAVITYPAKKTTVTVTSSGPISGSWVCEDIKVSAVNDTNVRVTLQLGRSDSIVL